MGEGAGEEGGGVGPRFGPLHYSFGHPSFPTCAILLGKKVPARIIEYTGWPSFCFWIPIFDNRLENENRGLTHQNKHCCPKATAETLYQKALHPKAIFKLVLWFGLLSSLMWLLGTAEVHPTNLGEAGALWVQTKNPEKKNKLGTGFLKPWADAPNW